MVEDLPLVEAEQAWNDVYDVMAAKMIAGGSMTLDSSSRRDIVFATEGNGLVPVKALIETGTIPDAA